jgi:signal transduction histidine kinase
VRLADFIERNLEPILAEWVTFAESSGPAGQGMDLKALRDHAAQMLEVIVADLRTPQSDAEQAAKSKGESESDPAGNTAAQVHGSGRAESGFSVEEMTSEYRALRASVIRLWTRECGSLDGKDIEDLTRFNEAIDQSLSESLSRYSRDIDRAREMFVAILGHELRAPLGAVLAGSQFMLDSGELAESQRPIAARIASSARRMNQMVADLLDFTWGRLGSGIPITRAPADLGAIVRDVVGEMRTAHPSAAFQVTASGDLQGEWDATRISQVLTNLLGNAVQHGRAGSSINVTAQGEADEVVLRMHNLGAAIPPESLPGLFSPFKRFQSDRPAARQSGNLGLGLYIAERIVSAHGGRIDVRSSPEAGTLFTVRLPRRGSGGNEAS